MKNEKIFDGITGIREDIIERAEKYEFATYAAEKTARKPVNKSRWMKWGAMAASLCLVVGAGLFVLQNIGGKTGDGAASEGSGGASGTVFMSYAGPVLPLTSVSDTTGITVDRNIDFDFLPYKVIQEGEADVYGEIATHTHYASESIVSDQYTLNNSTDQDISLTAVYGFAGSFYDKDRYVPEITVDGEGVDTTLYAGRYSGSFQSVFGNNTDETDRSNLLELTQWESYEALLADGAYLEDTLAAYPELDQQVIVYRLSEMAYTGDDADATNPTMNLSFYMDPEETTIMTWGSTGGRNDPESGNYHRHYDIPTTDWEKERYEGAYLLVLGEDITDLEMQGYKAGIYEEGKELNKASAKLERYEARLGDVLWEILIDNRENYEAGLDESEKKIIAYVPDKMLYGSVAELLYDYGVLSDDVAERYDFGMLEDMRNETYHMDRVMYLTFDVTVPAGGSVTIDAVMLKDGSFDFYGEGLEREGYDMMTSAGSNFMFTSQNASISNTEYIRIVGQNFGFDLENGITEVELDLSVPHYYLEVEQIEE